MVLSKEQTATIIGLSVAIGVTLIGLACIVWQFIRFRRKDRKKAEEELAKRERGSLQARTGDVPYRLGEDVFPSFYPEGYRTDPLMEYDVEYPVEIPVEYPVEVPIDYPVEVPVDYPIPVDYPVDDYPEPRGRFFPMDDAPYPMRPCIMPPSDFDSQCAPCQQKPDRIIVLEPMEHPSPPQPPPPQPPPPQEPIIIYQPLPQQPPPPPQTEIIREIYIPTQPPQQPQPQPCQRERRGSWSGPSGDDWVLVKKEVKKSKPKKRRDDSDSDSSDSSDDEVVPNRRRMRPYDLAMPTNFVQFPQPAQMPTPSIYFIQQPAAPPPPMPPPPPAPAPVAIPVPFPVPIPASRGNAFFAANPRRYDNTQYEEQEQRATLATDNFNYDCDDCTF